MPHPTGESRFYFGMQNPFSALSREDSGSASSDPCEKVTPIDGSANRAPPSPVTAVSAAFNNQSTSSGTINKSSATNNLSRKQHLTAQSATSYNSRYSKKVPTNVNTPRTRPQLSIARSSTTDQVQVTKKPNQGLIKYQNGGSPTDTFPYHIPSNSTKTQNTRFKSSRRSALTAEEIMQLNNLCDNTDVYIVFRKLESASHDYIQHMDIYGTRSAVALALCGLHSLRPIPSRFSVAKFPRNVAYDQAKDEKAVRQQGKEERTQLYLSQKLHEIDTEDHPYSRIVPLETSVAKALGSRTEALNDVRRRNMTYIIRIEDCGQAALQLIADSEERLGEAFADLQKKFKEAEILTRDADASVIWHGWSENESVYLRNIANHNVPKNIAFVPRKRHAYGYDIDQKSFRELLLQLNIALKDSRVVRGIVEMRVRLGSLVFDRVWKNITKPLTGSEFKEMINLADDVSFETGLPRGLAEKLGHRICAANYLLRPYNPEILALNKVQCEYRGEFYLVDLSGVQYCFQKDYISYLGDEPQEQVLNGGKWFRCESRLEEKKVLTDLSLGCPHEQSLHLNFSLTKHNKFEPRKKVNTELPHSWPRLAGTIRLLLEKSDLNELQEFMAYPEGDQWPLQKVRLTRTYRYSIIGTGYQLLVDRTFEVPYVPKGNVPVQQGNFIPTFIDGDLRRDKLELSVIHNDWGVIFQDNLAKPKDPRLVASTFAVNSFFPKDMVGSKLEYRAVNDQAITVSVDDGSHGRGLRTFLNKMAEVQDLVTGDLIPPPRLQKHQKVKQPARTEIIHADQVSDSESEEDVF